MATAPIFVLLTEQRSKSRSDSRRTAWNMWAGQLTSRGYLHVVADPNVLRQKRISAVPVVAIEDPNGSHWGWVEADSERLTKVQPDPIAYVKQFPTGPALAGRMGLGRSIRLRIERGHAQ